MSTTTIASPLLKSSASRARGRITIGKTFVMLMLLAYLLITVYPVFWLFYTSLKPDDEIFLHPFRLPSPSRMDWANFSDAWTRARFSLYLVNSLIITISTVAVTVFIASTTAFAVSRYRFRLARPMLFFFLGGLMIPVQLVIVPLFFQMKQLDLLDNRFGLFLAYVAHGLPFSVFILTGFFKTLPRSLQESARLDGCSEWQVFWHVMLPLSRPGLITVGIFLFLGNWSEFFIAFIFLSRSALHTLPLGLANITIVSQARSDWGVAFAGLVLMMVPTLIAYLFLQKHLIKGMTAGAMKG